MGAGRSAKGAFAGPPDRPGLLGSVASMRQDFHSQESLSPLDPEASVQLLRQARAGDQAAFGELFGRCHERVMRVVRLRMGSDLRAALESVDLAQETYLAALRDFSAFRGEEPGTFLHWLARIAENRVRDSADHWKAQRRTRDRELPREALGGSSNRSGAFGLPAVGPSPSEQVAANELRAAYDACVAELPERQREVVLLRDYEGLGWAEAAELLGSTLHAAQQLYHRAQMRLAERLEDQWKPPV